MSIIKTMEKNTAKNSLEDVIFPENNGLIIKEILDNYGIKNYNEELLNNKRLSGKEIIDFLDNMPGKKVAILAKKYALGEIPIEDLPSYLEKDLSVPKEFAEKITSDLTEKLFIFIKTPEKKSTPSNKIYNEKTLEENDKLPEAMVKKTNVKKSDNYRESIE